MPYAFVDQDGQIVQTFQKPNPFMVLGEGQRMVSYDPPKHDWELEDAVPVTPVPELSLAVEFMVNPKPGVNATEVWARRKSAVIQQVLDATAVSKGYDSILSAVSYASSGHPIYGPEGQQFLDWRDACWAYLFAVLEQQTPVPSDEELLAGLPTFGAGA